jgi:hypothetical protein
LAISLPKVSGRARKYGATEVSNARLDLGVGEARVDLLFELVDDLDGRVLGGAQAERSARRCSGAQAAFARRTLDGQSQHVVGGRCYNATLNRPWTSTSAPTLGVPA